MRSFLSRSLLGLLLLASVAGAASAQQTGLLVPGSGATFLNYLPLAAGAIPVGQGVTSNPAAALLSGDCTMNSSGVVTCLKTNGTSFGTAALANVGTSGSALPQLNASNTWASGTLQTFLGHLAAGTSAPTLSSCGTSPAIVGDDKDGQVTMGTGSPTGCIITFASAYTSTPLCTVSWQGNPLAAQNYSVTATAITLTQTATSSNKANYHCAAQNGG